MSRSQYIVIGVALAVLGLMYFGCDTKPQKDRLAEKSRALQMEVTGIQNLQVEARKALNDEDKALLEQRMQAVRDASQPNQKSDAYKQLSGLWFELGRADIAGYYAEEVAKIDSTDAAWGMAGTTYLLAVRNTKDVKVREWSSKRAISAFEYASTLAPDVVDHKINLALAHVDNPASPNPMKGILMLKDLNEQDPNEVKVIHQLARLAIRTNQWEKAIQRLTHALTVDPNNQNTNCLLAQAYKGAGQVAEASKYQAICSKF